MKPLPSFLSGMIILCGMMAFFQDSIAQQSLSGSYTMQSGEVTLTLNLTQQGAVVQGSLSGSTGASFQLSGQVENGIGYGTCSGQEGTVFFEAYADGNDLTLSLIEPDQWGAPDYNQAQYLLFQKINAGAGSAGASTGAVTGALGLGATGSQGQSQGQYQRQSQSGVQPQGQYQSQSQAQPQPQGQYRSQSQAQSGYPQQNQYQAQQSRQAQRQGPSSAGTSMTGRTGTAQVGENEVGDPAWGIKFSLPSGWLKKQSMEGAIVGHNTIAGMILVYPHMAGNLQEMQAEMLQGIQEEGSYLSPGGGLQQISGNVLAGDYSGVADGTQVKARGFGILSPNGGGAYIIALSTPDKLGRELIGAAESMVNTVQYFHVDVSDLTQHFAGNWSHFTTNTSTWICFCADGTYTEKYESSYAGDFTDGAGNINGNWGAAGGDSDRGRWTVRGNKDSGTIIVKMANGKEIYYEYRVHTQNGRKYYHEYYFNGDFYSKSD